MPEPSCIGWSRLCMSMSSTVPQELAEKLRHEDRENGRGRKWRTNYNKLNAQLLALENDHHALELVHPQVNNQRGVFHSHEPASILRCQSAQHHIKGRLTETGALCQLCMHVCVCEKLMGCWMAGRGP